MATRRATRGAPAPVQVDILNRQRRRRVSAGRLRRVVTGAAEALGVSGELAVMLTGDAPVRRLNARYRGKDEPTDVLSFPGPGGREGLGDVVISVETAARNAPRFRRTLREELDVLVLHGFLHVLGYDHETDDGEMEGLERRLRKTLLAGPAAPRRGR